MYKGESRMSNTNSLKIKGKINFDWYKIMLVLVLIIGFAARLLALGSTPTGLNQDEAYAGYEAYSLLNYHMDSHGYANPVYFTSWGSGMNVLYSYLTIPVIALTGNHLTVAAVRFPQALFACISLWVFYLLLKEILSDKKQVLLGTLIFAVMPWHIMIAHWGLESNIAPAFLLFGTYFLVKAVNNTKFYIPAAIAYGLSLYSYAPLWLFVPLILVLVFLYLLCSKKFKLDAYLVIGVIILFVLALPLMLFLLVNNGFISEINTRFFSIPKLLEYRGGELSLSNLKYSIYNFYTMFSTQSDDLIWNSTSQFGMYYKFSTPFILIGVYRIFADTIKSIKSRSYNPITFIAISILAGLVFALLIGNINVNKVNTLHIPLIFALVIGLIEFASWFKKNIYQYIAFIYIVAFIAFGAFYFNMYDLYIASDFQSGIIEAVDFAEDLETDRIYVNNDDISFAKVLFATEYPATDYVANATFDPELPFDAIPVTFGKYMMRIDTDNLDDRGAYIILEGQASVFSEQGFNIETFDKCCVAYK